MEVFSQRIKQYEHTIMVCIYTNESAENILRNLNLPTVV